MPYINTVYLFLIFISSFYSHYQLCNDILQCVGSMHGYTVACCHLILHCTPLRVCVMSYCSVHCLGDRPAKGRSLPCLYLVYRYLNTSHEQFWYYCTFDYVVCISEQRETGFIGSDLLTIQSAGCFHVSVAPPTQPAQARVCNRS